MGKLAIFRDICNKDLIKCAKLLGEISSNVLRHYPYVERIRFIDYRDTDDVPKTTNVPVCHDYGMSLPWRRPVLFILVMLLPARSVTRVVDEFTKVCEIVKDITARHASDPSKYNEGEIIDSSYVTITQDGKYTLVITMVR